MQVKIMKKLVVCHSLLQGNLSILRHGKFRLWDQMGHCEEMRGDKRILTFKNGNITAQKSSVECSVSVLLPVSYTRQRAS